MDQIIVDNMKKYIKDQLKENGYKRCMFGFPLDDLDLCHFLADPACGHYGEYIEIPRIPQRKDFYKCRLKG
jgi:hypothetical protein